MRSASPMFPLSAAATARASASVSAATAARAPLEIPACFFIGNSSRSRYLAFDVEKQAGNEKMRRFIG
jgi:hypothetical protein